GWKKSRATSCVCCTEELVARRSTSSIFVFSPKENRRGVLPRGDLAIQLKLRLDHAERLQRWLIHRASWLEALRRLIFRERSARLRPKHSVDIALIVALLLERGLHVGYDLAGVFMRTRSVDRSIINVDRVRSITPRRVPVGTVPVIPAAVDEDDLRVMPIPPPGVMPKRMVVREDLILRAFPFVSAGNLVVRVVIDRLVLVNDVVLVVRLQIELLLLELVVLVPRHVLVGVHVHVLVDVLRLVELRLVRAGTESSLSLPILRFLPLLVHRTVVPDRAGLLEVLIVRSSALLLVLLAAALRHDSLLLLLFLSLLFTLRVVIVLVVVLS